MYLQNKYTYIYYCIINRAKSRTLSEEIYSEKHHIIPRSLGGTNDLANLAVLTAREHFICHLLLPKMLTGTNKRNMSFAIWSMLTRDHSKNKSRYKVNSHWYETIKKQVADATSHLHKGKVVSNETRKKISAKAKGRTSPNKGKPMSAEQKEKISAAHKGKTISADTIAKILETRKDYKHSPETKQKISNSNKGKTVVISTETKQKISDTLKGRVPTWLKGKPARNRGVPMSDSAKRNMSKGHQNREMLLCLHCSRLVAKCSFSRWHGDNCKLK
jgi:hypothetical protein